MLGRKFRMVCRGVMLGRQVAGALSGRPYGCLDACCAPSVPARSCPCWTFRIFVYREFRTAFLQTRESCFRTCCIGGDAPRGFAARSSCRSWKTLGRYIFRDFLESCVRLSSRCSSLLAALRLPRCAVSSVGSSPVLLFSGLCYPSDNFRQPYVR